MSVISSGRLAIRGEHGAFQQIQGDRAENEPGCDQQQQKLQQARVALLINSSRKHYAQDEDGLAIDVV